MPRAEPEPAADVWGRVAGVASDTGPRPLAPPPLPSPAWRGPLFRTQRGAPYYEDLETLPWKTNCKNLVRWSMPREAPVVLVTLTNPPETEWLAELARGLTWDHKACTTTDEVAAKLDALELALPRPTAVVVAALGTNEARSCWPLLRSLGACAPNWRNGSENQVMGTSCLDDIVEH